MVEPGTVFFFIVLPAFFSELVWKDRTIPRYLYKRFISEAIFLPMGVVMGLDSNDEGGMRGFFGETRE